MKQTALIQKVRGKSFMGNSHFVYILQCKDKTLYTGYTTDVRERLNKHRSGKGAKYTRGRGPFKVRYVEELSTKEQAMSKEYAIKKLTKDQKLELIKLYEKGGKTNSDSIEL